MRLHSLNFRSALILVSGLFALGALQLTFAVSPAAAEEVQLPNEGSAAWQSTNHELRLDMRIGGYSSEVGTSIGVYGSTSPSVAEWGPLGLKAAVETAGSSQLWIYEWSEYPAFREVINTGLSTSVGVPPSIANDGIAVFRAPNGELVAYNTNNQEAWHTGLGVGNVAPAVASYVNENGESGSWAAAFDAAANGHLWWETPSGSADTGLGIQSGTRPSDAGLSNGWFEAAFVAAGSGKLWVDSIATGPINTGISVASGSSPSIASWGTGWRVAFVNSEGYLSTYNSNGEYFHSSAGVKSGTGPGINDKGMVVYETPTGALATWESSRGAQLTGKQTIAAPAAGDEP